MDIFRLFGLVDVPYQNGTVFNTYQRIGRCLIQRFKNLHYLTDYGSEFENYFTESQNVVNHSASQQGITPAAIIADVELLAKQQTNAYNGKSISAMDLLNRRVETIPCLVEPLLQKVGLACIAGSSDTGKSSLLRYLCMCIVSGETDFLGFTIRTEHRRAIYVSTEDDETAIAYLLNKQNRDMQVDPEKAQGLRFIFDTENLLQTLDGNLTESPADVVCIDAFTDLYGRSMNESNQVRTFLNEYSQLAQKHQCLILFLHHTGKRTEDGEPSKHNLLGSQAIESKMRLVMELRNDMSDTGLKHLCIVKGNYLPAEYKKESYQLRFTENMTFVNTGERIPFENLAKVEDAGRQKYELIKMYQEQGLSMEEIGEKLGINKSNVSRFLKKFGKNNDVAQPLQCATECNDEAQRGENDTKMPF